MSNIVNLHDNRKDSKKLLIDLLEEMLEDIKSGEIIANKLIVITASTLSDDPIMDYGVVGVGDLEMRGVLEIAKSAFMSEP